MRPTLSVVVLNYNTKDLVLGCVKSLLDRRGEVDFEIIVVDNGSSDESVAALRQLKVDRSELKIIENKNNLGFSRGNNAARNFARGKYILFLNSDTLVKPQALSSCVAYLDSHPNVGVVTCKQILPSGKIDPDSRRSFPTPWVAFTHFTFLDRIFPHSTLLARYWYGYRNENEVHEIDVCQGAFMMSRKDVLDSVGWFSEEYFLDGEDIDLSWKIKSIGYKIIYYPKVSIIHLKKGTKKRVKGVSVGAGVDSMLVFYRKFMWDRYPTVVNWLVVVGVKMVKFIRQIRKFVWI